MEQALQVAARPVAQQASARAGEPPRLAEQAAEQVPAPVRALQVWAGEALPLQVAEQGPAPVRALQVWAAEAPPLQVAEQGPAPVRAIQAWVAAVLQRPVAERELPPELRA